MTSKQSTSLEMDPTERHTATTDSARRRFLSAVGAGGVVALAGCLGSDGDDDENGNDDTDDNDGSNGDDEVVADSRFGYTHLSDDGDAPIEADHTVELQIRSRDEGPVPEFYFEPTGLSVEVGDTVEFAIATPHHNVNAFHPAFGYEQRVPDGVPPFSSPVLTGGDSWFYTFEAEGVYDYTCAPHETFGMSGRIVVGEATGPGAEPIGEAPGDEGARPPEGTSGTVLADPALDGDAIVDAGSVSWDDLAAESKELQQGGGHAE